MVWGNDWKSPRFSTQFHWNGGRKNIVSKWEVAYIFAVQIALAHILKFSKYVRCGVDNQGIFKL